MRISVANAPCSWGALEFQWAGHAPPYTRVLDEMAATGYSGTELGDWGFLPTDPPALRRALDRVDSSGRTHHLTLVGAFVPVRLSDADAHAAGVEAALRVARLIAAASSDSPLLVLSDDTAADPVRTALAGRITPQDSLPERAWNTLSSGAQLIAKRVRAETGLRTVFHHHCATFVEAPWEIDELMKRTDPDVLGLCLDTGHCTYGRGDPLEVIDKWGERILHVHFKDCDPELLRRAAEEEWPYPESVRQGVFCELGRGIVDFRSVIARLQERGYAGWAVVEQDVIASLGTPAESAARNRDYLRSIGL